MNTIWADREGVHDSLADPREAVAWLSAVGPRTGLVLGGKPDRVAPEDRARLATDLRRLRDALRRLAAVATADDRPTAASTSDGVEAAVADVNRAAAAAPRWSAMERTEGAPPRRVMRSARSAPDAVISEIADAAITLLTGPERDSLRACHAPGCVLYFIKQHQRREWCSAACGNRARVARHYRRQRHSTDGQRSK
jgi:predicted RNA-binding Zn ribbon-like protein